MPMPNTDVLTSLTEAVAELATTTARRAAAEEEVRQYALERDALRLLITETENTIKIAQTTAPAENVFTTRVSTTGLSGPAKTLLLAAFVYAWDHVLERNDIKFRFDLVEYCQRLHDTTAMLRDALHSQENFKTEERRLKRRVVVLTEQAQKELQTCTQLTQPRDVGAVALQ